MDKDGYEVDLGYFCYTCRMCSKVIETSRNPNLSDRICPTCKKEVEKKNGGKVKV